MIMVRELTNEEIAKIVNEQYVSISPTDAIQFARALFEAAKVQQSER